MLKITKEYVLEKLQACKKFETPENRQRHIKIVNSNQEIIGVSMAEIRAISKQILKCDYQEFLENAKQTKNQDEFYEETLVQGLVIAGLKDLDKQKEYVSWFAQKIDNWGICDSMVSTMKTLKNSKEKSKYFEFYYNLCLSRHEFEARFGIVCLMTNFLEKEYIDKILLMCESVKNEAYYVQMAIAWLLSYSYIDFKDKTEKFLSRHVLSKFAQNKAISKCRDSFRVSPADKLRLKEFKIK